MEPNHTFGPGDVFLYLDESRLPGNGFQNKLRFGGGNTKASLDSKVETSLDTLSLKPQHLPSHKEKVPREAPIGNDEKKKKKYFSAHFISNGR